MVIFRRIFRRYNLWVVWATIKLGGDMPVPRRRAGEKIENYRKRLIRFFIDEGRHPDQAVAIAYSITGGKKKKRIKK